MRIEQLTFTRFLAAVAIVFFHYGRDCSFLSINAAQNIVRQMNIGVSYFFILSGFVLIIAYQSKEQIRFFSFIKNRLARIYPAYFLGLLGVLALTWSSTSKFDLALNVLMIQSWFSGKALTVNQPGWSLSVELFFYLLFPFLFNWVYRKSTLLHAGIAILFCWICSQAVFLFLLYNVNSHLAKDILYFPALHLNQFLGGNFAGILYLAYFKECSKNVDGYIVAILLLLLFTLSIPLDLIFHNGLFAVFFIPLILLIAINNGLLSTISNNQYLVYLGEISFGVYILQFPVWMIFSDERIEKYIGIDTASNYELLFFARLIILIAAAFVSYRFIETPFRNLIRRKK